MNKQQVVSIILKSHNQEPKLSESASYAPANIALVKYWGKRDTELNLPVTSSLSISLGNHGTSTKICLNDKEDQLFINGNLIDQASAAMKKLSQFLDLFRQKDKYYFKLECSSNIPIGAGVASSSAAFASIVMALNGLFAWDLDDKALSILARLGSGSACRSISHGFVEWSKGTQIDGMDSYGKKINKSWNELNIGLIILSTQPKEIGSREAMELTKNTSLFYRLWSLHVKNSLKDVKSALKQKDFIVLGSVAENNALAMHSTMLVATPAICYFLPETIAIFHKVWNLRKSGTEVYFTQDAGPNVKLLFQKKDQEIIKQCFANIEIIEPFAYV